jgi:hypothetical protein
MTEKEIYNQVRKEFRAMTLPHRDTPPGLANLKISAYNAYKNWLELNNPDRQTAADSGDADYYHEMYCSPY